MAQIRYPSPIILKNTKNVLESRGSEYRKFFDLHRRNCGASNSELDFLKKPRFIVNIHEESNRGERFLN